MCRAKVMLSASAIVLLSLSSWIVSLAGSGTSASQAFRAARQKHTAEVKKFGKLPLGFEANQGQTAEPVRFLARRKDFTLLLSSTGATLRFGRDPEISMTFGNPEVAAVLEGVDRLPGTVNYFHGNAFLMKFNRAGPTLLYATYVGGTGEDGVNALALDAAGSAYAAGLTRSADFPATPGSVQTSYGGFLADAFVFKIDFAADLPGLAGLVNGASFLRGPVAPGEIVALFGSGIGPETLAGLRLTPAGRVDTSLAETRVTFDEVPAPLLFVQANQIGAVVPYAVGTRMYTLAQVTYRGKKSNLLRLRTSFATLGIFTVDSSGKGQGAILNQDFSLNSPANPAERGSIVMLFATGEGRTTPPGVDGKPAADPLPRPQATVAVTVGGQQAEVQYAGGAPGLVAGVLQVNFRVPQSAPNGPEIPVQVTLGGNTAGQAGVTMSVR